MLELLRSARESGLNLSSFNTSNFVQAPAQNEAPRREYIDNRNITLYVTAPEPIQAAYAVRDIIKQSIAHPGGAD